MFYVIRISKVEIQSVADPEQRLIICLIAHMVKHVSRIECKMLLYLITLRNILLSSIEMYIFIWWNFNSYLSSLNAWPFYLLLYKIALNRTILLSSIKIYHSFISHVMNFLNFIPHFFFPAGIGHSVSKCYHTVITPGVWCRGTGNRHL